MSASRGEGNILLVECFYGGSHKQLIDLLHTEIPNCDLVTLPAKKWHWRARTGALCIADQIPVQHNYKTLFTSSVLNLAELVALRPDLCGVNKIVYFHENQLVYPVQKQQDRDFQYGYNQILSCLTADHAIFNSEYNKQSFLESVNSFLKLIPDHRPKNIVAKIEPKCRVLYFPIIFPTKTIPIYQEDVSTRIHLRNTTGIDSKELREQSITKLTSNIPETDDTEKGENSGKMDVCSDDMLNKKLKRSSPLLHIVWPHRWEHDKDPNTFFKVLFQLREEGMDFRLSVLGETYTDVPEIFHEARAKLNQNISHWGYLKDKEEYYKVLEMADVVVSTAKHEFFGVAMLEAVSLGCYPLCPNALVYPETFPRCCLYNTENQLQKNLRNWCKNPNLVIDKNPVIDWKKYSWAQLRTPYIKLFE